WALPAVALEDRPDVGTRGVLRDALDQLFLVRLRALPGAAHVGEALLVALRADLVQRAGHHGVHERRRLHRHDVAQIQLRARLAVDPRRARVRADLEARHVGRRTILAAVLADRVADLDEVRDDQLALAVVEHDAVVLLAARGRLLLGER